MDSSWVDRIRAGDERAFEAMFRHYHERLCQFAAALVRSPETAEEIVQDVFLNIWSSRHEWQVRSGITAYLYGAARNRALNYLAHRRIERAHEQRALREQAMAPVATPPADESLVRRQTAAAVQEAIEQLPERARLVVTLRWQHQLRHAEIAEVMGISVKGVENQLSRALDMLRRHLGPDS